MKAFKNIAVGFFISFIGSVPLGYLNVVGFEIYSKAGFQSLAFYLLGIISIEGFVIYFTLLFASRLLENKKLLKYISLFSIAFLFLLAYVFYAQGSSEVQEQTLLGRYGQYSPYLAGVALSALNFMQIPFWCGWNLYLVNSNYISAEKKMRCFYISGTLAGTFSGMLSFVLSLNLLAAASGSLSSYLMSRIMPLFFIGMALFQSFRFYKKQWPKAS
ncbi:MAG TPA: hypothetical protein VFR70_02215 [Flavobacterium sp.]|nr:hypothetical protein [Flavobacterium sp.]